MAANYVFLGWWMFFLVVLLVFAGWVGKKTGYGFLGILIDERGRYSLTHFQVVLWTLVILSSVLGVLIASGFDPAAVKLPAELLGLMGISAGSGVLATAVKANKDASGAQVSKGGTVTLSVGEKTYTAGGGIFAQSDGTETYVAPRFAQIWLEEEGDQHDKVVNITKYQNFIFTLVILGFYVTTAWKQGGIPTLPQSVVWLIGISHAGYVGGKVPNKP